MKDYQRVTMHTAKTPMNRRAIPADATETMWHAADGWPIRRIDWQASTPPRGSLLFLPGRGDHYEKYLETLAYYADAGWHVTAIDWRGQGASGRLLDDPFDPRCTEWLVEIPTAVDWADVPGADEVDIHNFSALAQFDFYMQVQRNYTAHNTSATIEYRSDEIEPLADRIHEAIVNDEGYISAALLARFDDTETFPRLPFEPIDKATYERLHADVLERREVLAKGRSFRELLLAADAEQQARSTPDLTPVGPAGCDGDKCLMPLVAPA
jgi:ribonucleotide reductase class II